MRRTSATSRCASSGAREGVATASEMPNQEPAATPRSCSISLVNAKIFGSSKGDMEDLHEIATKELNSNM